MEAWFAANMWWLLPVIAVGYLAIRLFDTHSDEPFHRRILYSLWPALEPGSRAQRRVASLIVGNVLTAIIVVVVAVLIWMVIGRV
mgnify:FL=1